MMAPANPALNAFTACIDCELLVAQVLVRREDSRWELRHIDDRARPSRELREVSLDDVRTIAQFTARREFRPLKSAPDLQSGWRFLASDGAALWDAFNRLYPGAIADWFAAQAPDPPVTHYREFAARQSGMYRITAMLSDTRAAEVINACCRAGLCLKRRLWTIAGLAPDDAATKSLIPCLEPCAPTLEAARKAARAELDQTSARAAR